MEAPGEAWAPVDASIPSAPRVYNFLNGGKDNFDADRRLAGKMLGTCPEAGRLAGTDRLFTLSGARLAASKHGIAQFIDLGCGLPLTPAVHDAARDGCPEAVVVYTDKDPMVVSHVSALVSGPGLAVVKADASDPARVLEVVADLEVPGTGRLIDFGQPAAVILGGTLSTMDSATARAVVAAYAKALAPGSAVIISCASFADPEAGAAMEEMSAAAGPWVNHGHEDVASFFAAGGLRIVHGRVMDLACWPACPVTAQDQASAQVLGGIGIVDGAR